ncbi:hypothetical protein L7F22_021316 [Adiantum nelumboides]|nr:hypothetical protein [Adiantum nelumboides]
MTSNGVVTVYGNGAISDPMKSSYAIKMGLAQMLRGDVIMDVVNAKRAWIAKKAGATAVMTLEHVPCGHQGRGRRCTNE